MTQPNIYIQIDRRPMHMLFAAKIRYTPEEIRKSIHGNLSKNSSSFTFTKSSSVRQSNQIVYNNKIRRQIVIVAS